MVLNLPLEFINRIQNVFKEEGRQFLIDLPSLIQDASARWGLTNIQPVSNLSYNFVAFAKKRASIYPQDVMLKIGIPNSELTSEMNALKLFNGNGACQLLDCDSDKGFLLLERLKPGIMLSELTDDDERTYIAVDVMQKMPDIKQQAVQLQSFINLSNWFEGLKKIRPRYDGGTGPFPKELLEKVESFLPDLFADKNVKLLHGDFHHFNILKSDRGWLVIDPKGIIGPAGYEIGAFMLNPWNSFSDRINFQIKTKRRINILAERLSWEQETIINWATAHAVLSAWWSLEDNEDWEYALNCAKIFSEIK